MLPQAIDELGCPKLEANQSGRGREFARAAQRRRVHPVFLLSLGRAGGAADLVQVLRISRAGRARASRVLKEFGLELDDDVEVRVWDSTAQIRYMVLPERPAGTEELSEDELAALVTRDSMVGTAKVFAPRDDD